MTQGTYGGGTFGLPWGGGIGLYMDYRGRIYPQLYGGTPGWSLSAGYTPDLEGLLTGASISGSPGRGPIRLNVGKSGDATGAGIGTPGIGVTHGFGPLEMSQDFSRPWAAPYIRDSAATAGIPSRQNVLEHGFPEPNPLGSPIREAPPQMHPRGSLPSSDVFAHGAAPIPFLPPDTQRAPRGLPAMLAEVGAFDPSNPEAPPAAGLPGLIQEYLRNH